MIKASKYFPEIKWLEALTNFLNRAVGIAMILLVRAVRKNEKLEKLMRDLAPSMLYSKYHSSIE